MLCKFDWTAEITGTGDTSEFKLETVLESSIWSCYWIYAVIRFRGTSAYNRFSTLLIADCLHSGIVFGYSIRISTSLLYVVYDSDFFCLSVIYSFVKVSRNSVLNLFLLWLCCYTQYSLNGLSKIKLHCLMSCLLQTRVLFWLSQWTVMTMRKQIRLRCITKVQWSTIISWRLLRH